MTSDVGMCTMNDVGMCTMSDVGMKTGKCGGLGGNGEPHDDYTVFLYFSQIANHVFVVHPIALSFIFRFQPLHGDFVPCSSHSSVYMILSHLELQVLIARTQQHSQ